MQVQVDIGFDNLVKIVKQLPKDELMRFKKELDKELVRDAELKELEELLLKAPTFSEEQIAAMEEARQEINKWRTK